MRRPKIVMMMSFLAFQFLKRNYFLKFLQWMGAVQQDIKILLYFANFINRRHWNGIGISSGNSIRPSRSLMPDKVSSYSHSTHDTSASLRFADMRFLLDLTVFTLITTTMLEILLEYLLILLKLNVQPNVFPTFSNILNSNRGITMDSATKRFKTDYPGVFFREAKRIGGKGLEKVYYIVFRKGGSVCEEKTGRQYSDGMTPEIAARIRSECLEGKRLSKKEIKEKKKADREINRRKINDPPIDNPAIRKLLEEKWLLFMESATDAFTIFDSKLCIIEANSATIDLLPPDTKKEDIIGKSLSEIVPNIKELAIFNKFRKVLNTGEFFTVEDEIAIPSIFGKDVHMSYKAFKVGDGLGVIAKDITERKRAERALKRREAELELRAKDLEEMNAALKVLLKKREEDKAEFEKKVQFNVKKLIKPHLDAVSKGNRDHRLKVHIDIMASNLKDIISPLIPKASDQFLQLTPIEIQVANIVKQGKTTKEIAALYCLSPKTIDCHRNNIRKKLGIINKQINLRTFLLSSG